MPQRTDIGDEKSHWAAPSNDGVIRRGVMGVGFVVPLFMLLIFTPTTRVTLPSMF